MIDLLRELPGLRVPGEYAELLELLHRRARARRAVARLPGRLVDGARAKHDVVDRERRIVRACRTLADDRRGLVALDGERRERRRVRHAPLRLAHDDGMAVHEAAHATPGAEWLLPRLRHLLYEIGGLHLHRTLDDDRLFLHR